MNKWVLFSDFFLFLTSPDHGCFKHAFWLSKVNRFALMYIGLIADSFLKGRVLYMYINSSNLNFSKKEKKEDRMKWLYNLHRLIQM